jgi:RNA polymerase sigma-70 factor, ECF subfamily
LVQGLASTSHADGSVITLRPCSFEGLYREYFPFTWRALRALGVPRGALDDAAQELWVVVHRRLGDFEGRSSAKTWLFGIAVNVARNERRRMRRQPPLESPRAEVPSRSPDPESWHEGREAWQRVESYLDRLDDERREIFVSCLLEGLSATEVAELTGLGVLTVYNRVRSLRRSFRAFVERQEGP